jgi:indole-3-glycerol phosphate synthase
MVASTILFISAVVQREWDTCAHAVTIGVLAFLVGEQKMQADMWREKYTEELKR